MKLEKQPMLLKRDGGQRHELFGRGVFATTHTLKLVGDWGEYETMRITSTSLLSV